MSSRVKPILRIITKAIPGVLLFLILSAAAYYFFWLSPRYVVPILTYHYFGYENAQGIDKRLFLLYVTPEHFQRQMRYLKDKHYNVISLETISKLNPSEPITSALLREKNIVKRVGPIKLLSDGEVSAAYVIRLDAVSENARKKIQAAGGAVE